MSLITIGKLLGLENDDRVITLHTRYSALLLARLKRSKPEIIAVPDELDYIVDELTIARFNRLGSEGMTVESMDGHSAHYDDISAATSLYTYEGAILEYLNPESESRSGRVIVW